MILAIVMVVGGLLFFKATGNAMSIWMAKPYHPSKLIVRRYRIMYVIYDKRLVAYPLAIGFTRFGTLWLLHRLTKTHKTEIPAEEF